jgi:uncharacterized membrane protein
MLWIALIGFVSGLRTMTGMAAVCWFAHVGLIPVEHTWAAWAGSWVAVVIFTLAALGEYAADITPQVPSRKALGPAVARLTMGGLAGAIGWSCQMNPIFGGVILGAMGALIGTHVGYWLRMKIAKRVGKDWPVGLGESALALTLGIADAWCLHKAAVSVALMEAGKLKAV